MQLRAPLWRHSWTWTLRCLLLFNGSSSPSWIRAQNSPLLLVSPVLPASCRLAPTQRRGSPCGTSWTFPTRRGDAGPGPKRPRRTTPRRPPRRCQAAGACVSAPVSVWARGAAHPVTCTFHVRDFFDFNDYKSSRVHTDRPRPCCSKSRKYVKMCLNMDISVK